MDDSQRFILEYFDVICNSPAEIYHHALPFSPSSSWIRECYSPEFSQEVLVVKGLQTRWGTCSRIVPFTYSARSLASWNDLIAVGLGSGNITILDAITGTHLSILFGHKDGINSLIFSSDGTFLVSGSGDQTVKLWDVQTGGVVRTFYGHTAQVYSVSISLNHTTIASGAVEKIYLWSTLTGKCNCIIDTYDSNIEYLHTHTGIKSINFSPTNSQILISASTHHHTVQQWDINGQKIGPSCEGSGVVFSPDGTSFVSWRGAVATIQNSNSRVVVTELHISGGEFQCCCFSPNGKFVAGSVGCTIYVWDITSSIPHLIETFLGHTSFITSLEYSSSIISSSNDRSVRFWQISSPSKDPVTTNSESILPDLAPIKFVSLQGNDGIAISSDGGGAVRIWDISTGLCKESFHIPVKDSRWRDVQLINGRLISVWHLDEKIYIWDTKKGKLIQMVNASNSCGILGLKISGDGSKVFLLSLWSIKAWSTWTGEASGEVIFMNEPLLNSLGLERESFYHLPRLKGQPPPNFYESKIEPPFNPLIVDGLRVWVCFEDSKTLGWDFGTPDSPLILSTNFPPPRFHLDFINGAIEYPPILSRIKDTVTGEVVFWLSGRYEEPSVAEWNGRYLVAGYKSGEVLILDFIHIIPQ